MVPGAETTENALMLGLVLAGRLLLPLLIFRFPIVEIPACLVLDGVDQTVFPQLTAQRIARAGRHSSRPSDQTLGTMTSTFPIGFSGHGSRTGRSASDGANGITADSAPGLKQPVWWPIST